MFPPKQSVPDTDRSIPVGRLRTNGAFTTGKMEGVLILIRALAIMRRR